eukprot:scaffold65555_cov33-Phaeocystis_antarctica.AAC.1
MSAHVGRTKAAADMPAAPGPRSWPDMEPEMELKRSCPEIEPGPRSCEAETSRMKGRSCEMEPGLISELISSSREAMRAPSRSCEIEPECSREPEAVVSCEALGLGLGLGLGLSWGWGQGQG